MQSVPITTKVLSSNPVHGEVYSIQYYVIKFVNEFRQAGGFLIYLLLICESITPKTGEGCLSGILPANSIGKPCWLETDFATPRQTTIPNLLTSFGHTGYHLQHRRAVMVVILWQLVLQLSMQSVSITIKVVSSNPIHGEVYSIQHFVNKFVSELLNLENKK